MTEDACLDIVNLLLAAGARADVPDKVGDVPLHLASRHPIRMPVVERLLKAAPAMVNHQNGLGHTPLLVAVDHKWADGVARLLAHGADATKQDLNGKSILEWAPNAKIRALLENRPSATQREKSASKRAPKPAPKPAPKGTAAPKPSKKSTKFERPATRSRR